MRVCHMLIGNATIELVLLVAAGCTYFFLALFKLSWSVENEVQDVLHLTDFLRALFHRSTLGRDPLRFRG